MRWPQHALVICTAAMLSLLTFSAHAHGDKRSGVETETLLESEHAWDGTQYSAYPQGTPQLSVLKITIPPTAVWPGTSTRSRMPSMCRAAW
ncbi:hypothetical protein GGER_34190 [Serratia rubidaea]